MPVSSPAPAIIPEPVSMTMGRGEFTLTPGARIAVAPGSPGAWPAAEALAACLRPATGYPLPVATGSGYPGDIVLSLGPLPGGTAPGSAVPGSAGADAEGYRLDVTPSGATLTAPAPHGLHNGVQTLRQLLPAWISSAAVRAGPWAMPAVHIIDYPRYAYRGYMIDIARHYQPPSAVRKLIGQLAAYKINYLHLHLSDDQGFRIVIDGFPRLTEIGGQCSAGTGGRPADPGGHWTRADYEAVVADAAAQHITVVPEIDTPGHTNAIIMAEYGDTANPLLDGHPQDINCGRDDPPRWDFTPAVRYSALCPDSQNTWAILTAIIRQLAVMTPGPYHHIGGDEVPAALLSPQRYAAFVSTEASIVRAAGKTVIGWAEIAAPGTTVPAGSVAEYWRPAPGAPAWTATAAEAVRRGLKVLMAPANHTYLDQKYAAGEAGNIPPALGSSWACPAGCNVGAFYNWDPAAVVPGVTGASVIGVEAALWGETVATLGDVEYMTFPRLLATAEVAWSPPAARAAGGAFRGFAERLAAHGARLMAAGINFCPSAEIGWRPALTGSALTADGKHSVSETVATLAAPGFPPGALAATIDWGDGTSSPGDITGTPPGPATRNSLYAVGGRHTYPGPGLYHGTITASASGSGPATAPFTVTAS